MLENGNGCDSKSVSEANFVSPLQKKTANDSDHLSQHCTWIEKCYELLISSTKLDSKPALPIDGGSDAGMFCVVGSQLDVASLNCYLVDDYQSSGKTAVSPRGHHQLLLQPGDIILVMNDYEVSGYTRRDAVELFDALARVSTIFSNSPTRAPQRCVRLRLCSPQAMPTGSTLLSSFLAAAFPLNSPEYALQEKIRENVYQRVVPCTTRLPRADEVDGVHYRFMSVPQFIALERSGKLLESGVYKGNHYGTPRPDPNASALDSVMMFNRLSVSTSSSVDLMSDDTCLIPPPLPPLSSLTVSRAPPPAGVGNLLPIGGHHQHPAPPPAPPVRHSSISQASSSGGGGGGTGSGASLQADSAAVSSSRSDAVGHDGSNRGSIDLGPLSSQWEEASILSERSGGADKKHSQRMPSRLASDDRADITVPMATTVTTDSQLWKGSGVYVNEETLVSSFGTPDATGKSNADNANQASEHHISGLPISSTITTTTNNILQVNGRHQPLDPALPYGWEIVRDPKYGSFYIDHINKRTQYEPPTESDFALASAVQSRIWSSASCGGVANAAGGPTTVAAAGTQLNPAWCIDRGRVTPNLVTSDPQAIQGPIVSTSLVKSPRGFGFTIVGGVDSATPGLLQVKHVVPGGPAALGNCLAVGDVLVKVNLTNVLEYTHTDLVQLLQSFPVGSSVSFTVSQGYRLRSAGEDVVAAAAAENSRTTRASFRQATANPCVDMDSQNSSRPASPNHSSSSNRSTTPPALAAQTSAGPKPSFVEELYRQHGSYPAAGAKVAPSTGHLAAGGLRQSQRPEFVKVSMLKQANGFGFTLADHPQGQHVKAILDSVHCGGRLHVGDVIVEINDQRVKETPHAEVVQMLKQCPVGQEARLLIQRGGLYTSPLSSFMVPGGCDANSSALVTDQTHLSGITVMDSKVPVSTPAEQNIPSTSSIYKTFHSRTESLNYSKSMSTDDTNDDYEEEEGFLEENAESVLTNSSASPRMPARPHGTSEVAGAGASSSSSSSALMVGATGGAGTRAELVAGVGLNGGRRSVLAVDHRQRQRQRLQPMDDSVLPSSATFKVADSDFLPGLQDTGYGSLLRPSRMTPLRQTVTGAERSKNSGSLCYEPGALREQPYKFMMLPGEFLVHLQRLASSGFGFRLMGGAEEHSQVMIGSLVPGGSADRSGVMRTGDRVISVNGKRVIGARHREVLQLLEQAAHTLGQVTLGLQRSLETAVSGQNSDAARMAAVAPVEVVIPRSETTSSGDAGFGFFISNLPPASVRRDDLPETGEYIAQVVPGSRVEQFGLLSVGDRILAVNKTPINGLHHDQVVRLIREGGSHIVLTVVPSVVSNWAGRNQSAADRLPVSTNQSPPAQLFPVTLFRGSRGFGFSLRGGQEFNRMPLLVLRIADGGAAQLDGRLKVGDELVEINGYTTESMSHSRAIEIIQSGGNVMRLVVRRFLASPNRRQGQATKTGNSMQQQCQQHRLHNPGQLMISKSDRRRLLPPATSAGIS